MASGIRRISQLISCITLMLVLAVGVTSGVSYLEPEATITQFLHDNMEDRHSK